MGLVTAQIQIDDHGATQRLAEYPALQKTAIARAITRTADWSRVRTLDAVVGAEGLALKKSDLDGRHRFGGITSTKANAEHLEAHVSVTGSRIPLFLFSGRPTQTPTRRGISYQITSAGGRQTIAHNAFFARMKTGHVGLFRRLSRVQLEQKRLGFRKAGRQTAVLGKLAELYGPSIPHVAEASPAFQRLLQVDAGERLELEMERQVNFILTGTSKLQGDDAGDAEEAS